MTKRSREEFDPPNNEDSPSASSPGSSAPSDLGSSSYEPVKILHIDKESGEAQQQLPEVMRCSLPPHRQTLSFTSFEEYEVHYNKVHVNRCTECRKNFPTPHFLDLHISENHNPLAQVLKERGEKTVSRGTLHIPSFIYELELLKMGKNLREQTLLPIPIILL
jgi:hypothetical protein